MAASNNDTWNFPTTLCVDKGTSATPRNVGGTGYYLTTPNVGFTSEITGIFSFLFDSNWTDDTALNQFIFSIGANGWSPAALEVYANNNSAGNSFCRINLGSSLAAATRYAVSLGHEDGVSWMQEDYWYQVAFAANASQFVYAVNKVASPTVTVHTNAPGSLDMDNSSERIWTTSASAAWGVGAPSGATSGWPSLILGPSAWYSTFYDVTSAANLATIYDADGNLRNPGETGTLWLGVQPDFYFLDGSPRFSNGSNSNDFTQSSTGLYLCPGGSRKAYEP